MFDIENDVYTAVATALRTEYPDIFVSGEYVAVPASFPAVTLVEADNYVAPEMSTLKIENAARVMYEANVYSNKTVGKKAEAKAIMAALDEEMEKLGFTRTTRNQVPNLNDATIYRLVARYTGVVGRGLTENTFMVYQTTR